MADSKTISAEGKEGTAPDWVLNDEYKIPGVQSSESDPQEFAALRTTLWRSGAYDLPPTLATDANQIAAECAALLPLLERVASRWVGLERAAVRRYADVPHHSNLSVPCTQNPDRRAADVAMQEVAETVNYDRLCGLAYAQKDPTVEVHSAGGHSELTAEDLRTRLTDALHVVDEGHATARKTIVAVRDALEAQLPIPPVAEAERVIAAANTGTGEFKATMLRALIDTLVKGPSSACGEKEGRLLCEPTLYLLC